MKEIEEVCPWCNQVSKQIIKPFIYEGIKLWEVFCRNCKKKGTATKDYSLQD